MALTTLSRVKEYLGITDTTTDTVLTNLLAVADKYVKNYCGRNFEYIAITNEKIKTDGVNDTYMLKEYPVDEDEDVVITYNGTTLDSTTYELDYENGLVIFDSTPYETKNLYLIDYTAGYSPIPDDLQQVVIMLTADLFKAGGGGNANGVGSGSGEVKSEKLGDYSVTYAVSEENSGMTNLSTLGQKYHDILDISYKTLSI